MCQAVDPSTDVPSALSVTFPLVTGADPFVPPIRTDEVALSYVISVPSNDPTARTGK
ncbi:hypothetical protein D3C74_432700 [compost metagenome]